MSFITNAVQSVGHAVSSIFSNKTVRDLAIAAAAAYGGYELYGAATAAGASTATAAAGGASASEGIMGGLGAMLGSAGKTMQSAFTSIDKSLGGLFSNGFSGFFKNLGSIVNTVDGVVNKTADAISNIVSPIQSALNSVTKLANDIEDKLVAPIVNTIDTTTSAVNNLINGFHQDLTQGLQGLVKIPGQIADALTSVDAQFNRATQEMGLQTRQTAEQVVAPAITQGVGVPLTDIHTSLTYTFPQEDAAAVVLNQVKLTSTIASKRAEQGTIDLVKTLEGQAGSGPAGLSFGGIIAQGAADFFQGDISDSLEGIAAFAGKEIKEGLGLLHPLVAALWSIVYSADIIAGDLEAAAETARQISMSEVQPSLLAAGEIIEARRRNIIDVTGAAAEFQKHGYDGSRQAVLLQLAQFLFGPKETVELFARQIIDKPTFDTLMSQNNLSAGQADTLITLMQKILDPADIAAALARGLITDGDFNRFMGWAMVPPGLATLIQQLEVDPISPASLVESDARFKAAAQGFLSTSLQSPVPEEVKAAFAARQIDARQAEIDWVRHYRIPGPEWWVDAYFRGLRTREEVYVAFEALNVPSELKDDIFGVEEELPPVWLIPDVVASGVWQESDALAAFKKLGFSDANAKVLYDYGKSKSKATKAATAGDLAKISLGNAKAMFNDGIIDAQVYTEILLEHGYSQDAAALTVSLDQFNDQLAARKDQATLIVDGVKLGQLSKSDAESALYNLGLTSAEVAKYLLQIEKAKVNTAKLPTRAELDSMFKKGVIDQVTWEQTMLLLGYSVEWVARLLQIV